MATMSTLKNFLGMSNQNALTREEAERLIKLEQAFAQVEQAWRQGARILAEIRDKRLYRESYNTFAEYVEGRWKIDVAHAYRLIRSDQALNDVTPGVSLPIKQAEALSKVPPERRQEVFTQAGGETATVEQMEKAALPFQRKRKVKRTKPKDAHFRGKGWKLVIKRSKVVDLEEIVIDVLHQLQRKSAAA